MGGRCPTILWKTSCWNIGKPLRKQRRLINLTSFWRSILTLGCLSILLTSLLTSLSNTAIKPPLISVFTSFKCLIFLNNKSSLDRGQIVTVNNLAVMSFSSHFSQIAARGCHVWSPVPDPTVLQHIKQTLVYVFIWTVAIMLLYVLILSQSKILVWFTVVFYLSSNFQNKFRKHVFQCKATNVALISVFRN